MYEDQLKVGNKMDKHLGMKLNRKTFLQSTSILIILILLSGILTRFIPAGHYERITKDGITLIKSGSFHFLPNSTHFPIYRWFTAPIELFFSKDALTVIVIISFILIIGGSFAIFDETRVFERIIDSLVNRFLHKERWIIAIFSLFFMLLGSIFGILEEVIPLIPIMVLVAKRLGWDDLMGLGLSLLSVGFGFSAALFNPFTIGIAQSLTGVPIFSGILYRIVIFIVTYGILLLFLFRYHKKLKQIAIHNLDVNVEYAASSEHNPFTTSIKPTIIGFALLLVVMMLLPIIHLADYSMPIIALGIFFTALVTGISCKVPLSKIIRYFMKGLINLAPSSLLIILALSVKHIVESAHMMDTLLYYISTNVKGLGPIAGGITMYLIVFVLQFFIPSATAKALLVMPILTPIGDILGVTRQSVVLAFNFGDGFSHLLYPTNPALLIALSLTTVSFSKWLKWTVGIQIILFIVTMIFLILAILFKYGPI
jgi:uncharacterized ion transporter superfamily protein YfcC